MPTSSQFKQGLQLTARATGLLIPLVLGASALVVPAAAAAAPPPFDQRIEAQDNDIFDLFGQSVDIDGRFAVIGAPGDDEEAQDAGAAYVFEQQGDTWVEVQKLTAGDDASSSDEFGFDVAIARDIIAVGARWNDEAAFDAGAVYVFERQGTSWNEVAKLLPNDPSNSAYGFGSAVDVGIAVPDSGTVELTNIVVGAPRADAFQGVVFLFQRNGELWSPPIGRFNDSDTDNTVATGHFGSAVAIRGDSFVAGAPFDSQSGNDTGAAYVFGRTNINDIWSEVRQLYPSAPTAGDRFGASVALDEETIVIGAPANSNPVAGRVFVFDGPGEPTITTAGDNNDEYGYSVAVDGARIAIGSKKDEESAVAGGAVFFLERDELGDWQDGGKITAPDAAAQKQFGESVHLDNGSLIVGGGEGFATLPGAAYLYGTVLFSDGFELGDFSGWSGFSP